MHIGLITSLSIYPIKYLIALIIPYGSSLESTILLTSLSSVLNAFCFCKNLFS